MLTLREKKRSETEDKDRQFPEHSYGRFDRRIPRGYEIDGNTVEAGFRNGVLTVTLPRTEKAQSQVKRIPNKGGRLFAGGGASGRRRHSGRAGRAQTSGVSRGRAWPARRWPRPI